MKSTTLVFPSKRHALKGDCVQLCAAKGKGRGKENCRTPDPDHSIALSGHSILSRAKSGHAGLIRGKREGNERIDL